MMRKQGVVLLLDMEALRHVKGEFEKSVKGKQNLFAWIGGKWLGSPPVPGVIARVTDRIIVLFMKGQLTRASV